jgi:NADH-quinone oxidoreductase subunit N
MNLGAFTVAGLVWKQTGREDLEAFSGLGRRSPVLALCMACFMFSLVGLPPFAGFVAKVTVLWALIQNGGWWWLLVAVIGVNTILSLFYYMRVVKAMYLGDAGGPAFVPSPIGLTISIGSAAMLLMMLFAWGPLTRLTYHYSRVYSVTGQPPAPVASVNASASASTSAAVSSVP